MSTELHVTDNGDRLERSAGTIAAVVHRPTHRTVQSNVYFPSTLSPPEMDRISNFQRAHILHEFSRRALSGGRAYSMEGYVFNVDVQVERNGNGKVKLPDLIAASSTCFASYQKKRKHAVTLRMKGLPSFQLLKATCDCLAGQGEQCSHISGLVFHLLAKAAFLRVE